MIEQIIGGIANGVFNGLGNTISQRERQDAINKVNEQNYRMQKEFAQNSLSWKIKDGLKNGIHPLSAIGASTYQVTPSFVGSNSSSAMGDNFRHIGGLLRTLIDNKNEEDQLNLKKLKSEIENQDLENLKLRKEITGGNVFDQFRGSAGLGVPNNAPLTKDNAIPLSKLIKTDLDMAIVPTGVDNQWDLTLNPESQRGGSAQEGFIPSLLYNADNSRRLKEGLRLKIEKGMRDAGLLKKDEYLYDTYYGFGIHLEAVKKGQKPVNFFDRLFPRSK